jgi:hypothetical protein
MENWEMLQAVFAWFGYILSIYSAIHAIYLHVIKSCITCGIFFNFMKITIARKEI